MIFIIKVYKIVYVFYVIYLFVIKKLKTQVMTSMCFHLLSLAPIQAIRENLVLNRKKREAFQMGEKQSREGASN